MIKPYYNHNKFKSDHRNVYTEQVNKMMLISNDDKRLQTFDETTTYPYRTNTFKYEKERC